MIQRINISEESPARVTREPVVVCADLCKRFGEKKAVCGGSFSVAPGKLLRLVGPSGCGKTTPLRLLAGFERPDEGTVTVAGRVVAGPGVFVPPDKRNVGLIFQDYALFPHMTVAKNILYGMDRATRRNGRLDYLLDLLGLTPHREKYPHELSGGE